MRSPQPVRQHPTCDPRHWLLDQLLQPPTPTSGAGHENPCRGIRISGLTCAVSAGSIHERRLDLGRGGLPALRREKRTRAANRSPSFFTFKILSLRQQIVRPPCAEFGAWPQRPETVRQRCRGGHRGFWNQTPECCRGEPVTSGQDKAGALPPV